MKNNMKYIRQILLRWAETYKQADIPDFVRNYIARLYVKHNLESIRAIEAMQQGAVLYSITKDRDQATINDVTRMLPLILKHRLDSDTLIRVINDVDGKGGKESIFSSVNKKITNKPEPDRRNGLFQKYRTPFKRFKTAGTDKY